MSDMMMGLTVLASTAFMLQLQLMMILMILMMMILMVMRLRVAVVLILAQVMLFWTRVVVVVMMMMMRSATTRWKRGREKKEIIESMGPWLCISTAPSPSSVKTPRYRC